MYQGWGKTRKYFEGWYFKVVNADETRAFAFIPGISMNESGEKQAFIQVLDGKRKTADYYAFEASAFIPSEKYFSVKVGDNSFSSGGVRLNLPAVSGKLEFNDTIEWPNPWYAPGIMGPYTFAPFMECNHGIVSLDHPVSGSLVINGQETDFTGGRGYIEKDWGHSFPSATSGCSQTLRGSGNLLQVLRCPYPLAHGKFTGFITLSCLTVICTASQSMAEPADTP